MTRWRPEPGVNKADESNGVECLTSRKSVTRNCGGRGEKSNRKTRPSRHRRLIDRLVADHPEIQTRAFFVALRTLPDADYVPDLLANDQEWLAGVKFVPDAWSIDAEARIVFIFEIVDTNDISQAKFAKINGLAWALDEDHYRLSLTRIDRFGRRAYDVQLASMASSSLDIAEGRPASNSYRVPDWPDLTVAKCRRLMGEGAA